MKRVVAIVALLAATWCAQAREGIAQQTGQDVAVKQAIAKVQKQLQVTFTGVKPEFIGPGPIDGLYELIVGGRLVYYAPAKNWLLFGEFFSPEGISETQRRLSDLQARKIKGLPLDQAVVIGDGPNTVIEFVDPDCPFCRKWEEYANQRQDLKRYIFLVPLDSLHPTARGKAIAALCSKEPGRAISDFLLGRKGSDKLISCDAGRKQLAVHEGAAQRLGVTGTPTLVINGTLVTGFNLARIQSLLEESRK